MKLVVEQFSDGGLVLSGSDQDFDTNLDLVFSYGAMDENDPLWAAQLAYLEQIAAAYNRTES